MERASSLRSHAGQPSFPGGALDPEDGDPDGDGPLRAALREAEEETGLDPSGVQVFGVAARALHPGERLRRHAGAGVVAASRARRRRSIRRRRRGCSPSPCPISRIRRTARRPFIPAGHMGPAFIVGSALVWGFTAGVIDRILHYAGWEQPWDRDEASPARLAHMTPGTARLRGLPPYGPARS